jgi:hypothetical protein
MDNVWLWYFGLIILGFFVALVLWLLGEMFGSKRNKIQDIDCWETNQAEVDAMRDVRRIRVIMDRKEVDALFRESVKKR